MPDFLTIDALSKNYANGFEALKTINLRVEEAEILALLGPNGAGKTTLISTICGISKFTSGKITLAGHDIVQNYRAARKMIGMVPQELSLEPFETVMNTLRFSRGLFGKAPDDSYLEEILEQLSLLDKRKSQILELSGGMKRRVSIAKALSHEPQLLFLDEPTAGVDVELRKDMWVLVRRLRNEGVTVILTTHYIEEAEAIADRVGIIDKGQLLLVEEKGSLMQRLGQKQLTIELQDPLKDLPSKLSDYDIVLAVDRKSLIYTYNMRSGRTGINQILSNLTQSGIIFKDLQTTQSSLEDIFMSLVSETVA
jgi:ABC-2 type transport system ATP-binding protein